MANDREQQPVGRENPSLGAESSRAERRRRKPWTAPRLKTITADDVGTSNMKSVQDGTGCYIPA